MLTEPAYFGFISAVEKWKFLIDLKFPVDKSGSFV